MTLRALDRWVLLPWLLALVFAAPVAAETLLVVRKSGDAVDFIDPGSGLRLATVATGYAPHEISVSPDGSQAAVSNYGDRGQPGTTISILDLRQPRELRRIELAPHSRPHGVAWYAPDRIAVTTEGSRSLLLVDPHDGRIVSAIPTAQETSHMVVVDAGARRAYVTSLGSGTTSVLDLAAGTKLADVATGRGSEGIALSPDGRELWVAARADDALSILDARTFAPVARLPVAGVPIRIVFTPDGRTALVTCAGSGELAVIDTATRTERARHRVEVPLAPGAEARPYARMAPGSVLPVGLVMAPDGRSAYVAATLGDKVLQIDLSSGRVLREISVSGEPDGLASTPALPQATCHACASDRRD
jgi:DNA-binding beta-propeller fold protein YncE